MTLTAGLDCAAAKFAVTSTIAAMSARPTRRAVLPLTITG